MALILTSPAQTLSGIPGTTIIGKVVGSTITLSVDSVDAVYNYGAKWIITIIDSVDQKIQQFEVNSIRDFSNNVTHNKYSIIGDSILYSSDVVMLGNQITLQITNNEVHDIEINIIRIQTLI